VQIQAGGAKFDTNGFTVSMSRPLLHDPNVTTDGGLYKTGAGELQFLTTFANTYNGPTIVHQGTLLMSRVTQLPGYDSPGKVSVVSGATLSLLYGGGSN
jgi:autotransporter-associated beta strand protein